MTSRRSVLGGMAGLACACRGNMVRAGEEDWPMPRFRRGIGVSHDFGWAEPEAGGGYGEAPFAAERFRFDAGQRRAIRRAGFDFVRFAVDPGPFLAAAGASAERLDRLLLGTVAALLDDDLGVIVDLHPSAMNPAYRPAALVDGLDRPGFRGMLALQRRLAKRLSALARGRGGAPSLALELLNEPELPPRDWQPLLEACYRAARLGSDRLPLVLGGGSMNAAGGLTALDLRPFAGDGRLIYTYHDYSPWQFTHQGLAGSPAEALDAIAYPAPPLPEAMRAATQRRIQALGLQGRALAQARAAQRSLSRYAGFDRSRLAEPFRLVDAWRRAQGLPAQAILLGEFGVHRTPYLDTVEGTAARACWLRDMRELAEAHGIAWCCWTYAGAGGFALAEGAVGPGFDAATRRALGLSP